MTGTLNLVAGDTSARFCVLALDPGVNCGWAVGLESGTARFKKHDRLSWTVEAADAFSRWLTHMIDAHAVTKVLCEETHARSGHARQDHIRFTIWCRVQAELIAYRKGIAFGAINPGTLKKWAAGSGRADDKAMVAAARRCGFAPKTPHEADALLMREMAESA